MEVEGLIERLEKLTGLKVALIEKEVAVPDSRKFNSMAQLTDHFRSKDFNPEKEAFAISRYKYTFKKAKPDDIDSVKLLQKGKHTLELIFSCKEAKSTITFYYSITDGILSPNKVVLVK